MVEISECLQSWDVSLISPSAKVAESFNNTSTKLGSVLRGQVRSDEQLEEWTQQARFLGRTRPH